ncbi:CDGSH iron-sulfur domain-containing protein [Streptomyces sp. NPDC005096]|uniref:CDGSH iron-sulfur domain-containing protein n=1 Tax=Streptomyces sp. NPDC005096 TaxID=3154559 RepID=UPI0033B0FECB
MLRKTEHPRRIVIDRDGPILVEGPVEVSSSEGDVVVSERFVVAVCTCRRSRTYPLCDTSHRRRETAAAGTNSEAPTVNGAKACAAEAKDSDS